MARQWIPPRGFQKPWLRYSEGTRESVATNPLAMNNFLEVMRRPADPEIALRKHSEAKKPWQFSDISIMELTLGEIIDDFSIPPYANIHWPEGTRTYSKIAFPRIAFPKIGFTDSWRNKEDWQLNRRPPMEPWEIPAVFPYEPHGIVGQPGGQPEVIPPDMGKAFIGWRVIKYASTWAYFGSLVIYNHDNQYSFPNADNLFSRMSLSPNPGWKEAGASLITSFGQTNYTTQKKCGACVWSFDDGQYYEVFGVSRLIESPINKTAIYWQIDTATANGLDLISLLTTRIGKVGILIDGREIANIGQSVCYIQQNGIKWDYYTELNGRTQLLYNQILNVSVPVITYAHGDAICLIPAAGDTWSGGEHSD